MLVWYKATSLHTSANVLNLNVILLFIFHAVFHLSCVISIGIDRSLLLKSRGFSSPVTKGGDLHTGVSLWRKYREIKSFIINDISDILAWNMHPPSGLPLDDMFLRTR